MPGLNPAEASEMLLERFGQLAYQFLDASCEVWPEEEVLKSWKAKFDAANLEPRRAKVHVQVLFAEFLRDFKPLYNRINSQDATLLDEPISFLVKLKAAEKYAAASADVRETCWQYAKQIVQAASIGDVYSTCPDEMVKRVASLAETIVKDMETGSFDISKLNPADISRQMMEGMNPEDLEAWGKSLMNSGNLDTIMSLMNGVLGGQGGGLGAFAAAAGQGGGGLGALAQMAGNLDPSLLQSLLSNPNMQMPDMSLFMPKKK
jgi:hypothetical protein